MTYEQWRHQQYVNSQQGFDPIRDFGNKVIAPAAGLDPEQQWYKVEGENKLRQQYDLTGQGQADAEEAARKSQSADYTAKLNEFIQRMQAPINMNDPTVAHIVGIASQQAASQAAHAAKLQGVQGPLSVNGAQSAAANATSQQLNQMSQFNQGLGMQAMGLQGQNVNNINQLANNRYQFDATQAQQRQAANAAQTASMYQTGGQLLGGGVGLAVGGPAGASVGANLGGGAANLFTPKPYSNGGLSGGNSYGGGQ